MFSNHPSHSFFARASICIFASAAFIEIAACSSSPSTSEETTSSSHEAIAWGTADVSTTELDQANRDVVVKLTLDKTGTCDSNGQNCKTVGCSGTLIAPR